MNNEVVLLWAGFRNLQAWLRQMTQKLHRTSAVFQAPGLNLDVICKRARFFLMKENVIFQLGLNMFTNYCMPSPGETGPVPVLFLQTIVLLHLPVGAKLFTDKNVIQTNVFLFMEIQSLVCAIVSSSYLRRKKNLYKRKGQSLKIDHQALYIITDKTLPLYTWSVYLCVRHSSLFLPANFGSTGQFQNSYEPDQSD